MYSLTHDPNRPVGKYIDIVLDGPIGHDAPRFLEIENDQRQSMRIGEHLQRPDGYWVIRLSVIDEQRVGEHDHARKS